jgi:hypothetical protein
MMQSFLPPYSQAAVDDMHRRLRQTRWPQIVSGADSSMGVDRGFLQDLCGYWMNTFDWKSQLDRFATFSHYRYQAREGYIHFIHEKEKGPSPLPLILTHGWSGSFLEFLTILPLLTDPASYGHDAADAFDVVIPSLPGFGYSDNGNILSIANGMDSSRSQGFVGALVIGYQVSRLASRRKSTAASRPITSTSFRYRQRWAKENDRECGTSVSHSDSLSSSHQPQT